ncbi:hypothetical protein AKO1_014046 [Acrasis kona]|uniref:MARVEL domain-containing protein n=1 Tax=Acrasis kona TaxID=1008807 RepID=A0AAW2Z4X7_9EUKA
MATLADTNNYYAPEKTMTGPGSVTTQTVVTQMPTTTFVSVVDQPTTILPLTVAPTNYVSSNKKYSRFETVMTVLGSICLWIGSILIIAAMACLLHDGAFYATSIGVLLIIGFSFWLANSILKFIAPIASFGNSETRTVRRGIMFFYLLAEIIVMMLFVAGAGCWLSSYGHPRWAGEILWIIASSIWLAAVIIRDIGVRWEQMNTYKNVYLPGGNEARVAGSQPAPNVATPYKRKLGFNLLATWTNSILSQFYLVAVTLFLLGSILFDTRYRGSHDYFASRSLEIGAAVLWLVPTCFFFFMAIGHCIARRV